ncbi:hypothetical protein L6R52_09135 [Myxococcota bacterium]|nr:hypothetical protein [Myxococcota bacterium]
MDSAKLMLRRVAISLFVGLGVGVLAAALVAPSMIEWFNSPAVPTAFACTEQVRWALERYRTSLAISGLVAAVIAVVLVEVVRSLRAKKAG